MVFLEDLKHYDEGDQQLGPVIMENNIVTLQICGETTTLDRFLEQLLTMWRIQPCSNVFWRTIDGKRPQRDEPAIAMVTMKIHNLPTIDEGDPNLGRKQNACSCSSSLPPVS